MGSICLLSHGGLPSVSCVTHYSFVASVNLVPLLLTGVSLHPPAPKGGPTSKNLCRCFGAPARRVFPDHLIIIRSFVRSFPSRLRTNARGPRAATMAHVPCVLGTPVQDPAIPVGLPVRSAPVRFDSTGDGVVDSLGFDTTGDGWVDAVHRVDTLQRVDTGQTQHSAAPAIADQEQKRRAGRQFIEVAQVGAGSSHTHHCALLPKWLRRARGSLKGARERARTPSLAFLHATHASPPTSFPPPPAGERAQ